MLKAKDLGDCGFAPYGGLCGWKGTTVFLRIMLNLNMLCIEGPMINACCGPYVVKSLLSGRFWT